ncbi:hypothetical protein DFJ73DRAFT_383439 [Zopfochytrium polystomum]|nr:hypothetical protein DFJ73DRAFT_383439 [Zopfochytrium polystomum]
MPWGNKTLKQFHCRPLLTPSVSTNVEVIGSALKSDYVAPIRILKRDPQKKPSTTSRSSSSSTDSPNSISSDDGRKATPPLDGGASRSSSSESVSSGAGPAKTLAEREAEYRVARMRIFGKEDSEDSAGSTGAANDASSSGVSSSASAATGATAEGLPSRPGSTVSAVSRADTSRPRTPPEYSRRVNSVESQRVGSRGGAVLDAGGDVRTLTGYNRMPTGPPTNGGGWMGLGGSMSGGSGIGGGLGGGIAGSSLSGVGNGGMAIGVGQVGGGLGAGGPTWGNNSSFGAYLGAVPYSSGYPGLGGVGGFGAIPGNMSPYVPSGMPSAGNQTLSFQNGSSHGGNNTVGAYPPGSAPLPPSQLAGVGGAFRHNSSFSTPAGYSSPQLQQHVPPQSQSPGNPPHQQRYGLHPPHAFPHQQQQQQLGLLSQSHGFNPNTVPGGVRYSHPGSYHPYSGAGGGGPIMPLGPHPGHHHQQPGRYTQNNGNIGVGSGFNSAKTNFSSSNNGGSSSPGGFGGGHRSMYERSAGSSSSTTSTTSSYASTSSLISPRPQDEVVSGLPYGVSAGGGAMGSIGAVGAMGGGGGIVSTSTPLTYDRLTGGFVAYKGAAGRSTGPAAINGPGGGGSSGGGGGGGGGGNPAGRGTESAGV